VRAAGGRPVQCKSGHAFMKACMRKADAIYGGEMSGHHYFREFAYCDSGMIPWVILAQHLSRTGLKLSTLVEERMKMLDGLSIEHTRWRFNLRTSNTEPLIRLNVESRGEPALMAEKRDEILELLDTFA
jgi:phosphomannomutase